MESRYFSLLVFLSVLCIVSCTLQFWEGDVAENMKLEKEGLYNPYRDFNMWINELFFSVTGLKFAAALVLEKMGPEWGYYMNCYLRDLVAGTGVYWITGGVWHAIVYNMYGKQIFTDRGRPFPTTEIIQDQMMVAQSSLFVYAALPVLSEALIENKLTKVYFYVSEIGGWGFYFLYFVLYLSFHENKTLYKYVHGPHHKYNQAKTLTPWASIAFHPLDGILQASPYVIGLFFIPVHYFTHIFLLFFSGVWATNIHDSVWADSEPIMGAKYHTVHHT
jgi:lathosterol oxidase